MKIKTDSKKYGNESIVVSRLNQSIVKFSHLSWKRSIECSLEGFIQIVQAGYFNFENKEDYNSFLEQKKNELEIKLNENILFKKYKGKGMSYHLPKLFLTSGVITLLISYYLFITNSDSSGFVSYSLKGNSLLGINNTINWFHTFIIGSGLILAYITIKLYNLFTRK